VADEGDIERDLQVLETDLKRLEAEYKMFFAGRLPRPPWETRGRVESLIKRWDRNHIQGSAERFRFSTIQARFQTFIDLWDRALRAQEEGRPGPLKARGVGQTRGAGERSGKQVLHATSFTDPMREMDKLQRLYEAVMNARRTSGQAVVPFHRFAALVRDQVEKVHNRGDVEVAFTVTQKDGKVSLSAKGKNRK
jgi:hypothetical protein